MKFNYLFSILIFCGIPILIMVLYDKKELYKYHRTLVLVMAIGAAFAIFDFFAVRWGAWGYNPFNTLDTTFITEIETFIFGASVFLGVAMATILSAKMTDDYYKNRRPTSKRIVKTQRRVKRLKAK